MSEQICPRCHHRLKHWNELSGDHKFLAERLPASAEFSSEERKKHRFCDRCWYEESEQKSETA